MCLHLAIDARKRAARIGQVCAVLVVEQLVDARHQGLCLLLLARPLQDDGSQGTQLKRLSVLPKGRGTASLLLQERQEVARRLLSLGGGLEGTFLTHYIYI